MELVKFTVSEGVATVWLNRADKRNAINAELMQQLRSALETIAKNQSVRVLVLRGSGGIFSAGIDFAYASTLINNGKPDLNAFESNVSLLQGTITYLAELPFPTLALLEGACIGLGLELALGADFRIATESCRFAMPEAVLGLVADCGGTTRLIRTVGAVQAKWLLMTGEEFSAQRAYELGIVQKLVSDNQFEETINQIIKLFKRRNPQTLKQIKRLANLSLSADNSRMLAEEIAAQRTVLSDPEFVNYMFNGFAELEQRRKNVKKV